MKALISVDPQNDFIGGSLPVPGGLEIIDPINKLLYFRSSFNFTAITQDYHPAEHGSFASNNSVEPFTIGKLNGQDQTMWPDHCVQDTPGCSFHPRLHVNKFDHLIRKGMDPLVDSYSAFFDNAHQNQTILHTLLTASGIKDVYLCGLALDYCVLYSALDAVNLGYNVYIIKDLTRSIGPIDEVLASIPDSIKLVTSWELLAELVDIDLDEAYSTIYGE